MKIHVLHTGEVCVSPFLPFGGEHCNVFKAVGLTTPFKDRLWLPVSCYLIEHPKGLLLVDTGWHREISPKGKLSITGMIKALHSPIILPFTNQGRLPMGEAIDEQLAKMSYSTQDIDYVLLTHLDCDHACGLKHVRDAHHILVAEDELQGAKRMPFRMKPYWWKGCNLNTFKWNATEGPVGKSYDLFGDGTVELINIPGHCAGLCAVKLTGEDGHFVLLAADGGYASKSWEEMILPGISNNKSLQRQSLQWLHDTAQHPLCKACLANHDPEILPQTIEL